MLKRITKKYFIPHEGNEFKPHFLRERSVIRLAIIIVFIFLGAFFQTAVIRQSDFFAAVLPKVLADLANDSRRADGLPTLTVSPVLEEAAQRKAKDMAEKSYFAHVSPQGISPWYWFTESGYKFVYAGENLAVDFSESDVVNRAWLASPGHRTNILNKNFSEIGIATSRGNYQGHDTIFVVQLFGRPVSAFGAVKISPKASSVIKEVEAPPSVKGVKVAPATFETIYDDGPFVAVKNIEFGEEDAAPISELPAPRYASLFEKMVSSPENILIFVYMVLGSIIFIAVLLNIFIEVQKQHPRHIVYAVSLLLLMFALAYIFQNFLASSVLLV